jgi:serine/threonine protein kinase
MNEDEWYHIRQSAADLIKNMLNKDMNKRFSSEQCLNHEWLSTKNKNKFLSFENADSIDAEKLKMLFAEANQKLIEYNVT